MAKESLRDAYLAYPSGLGIPALTTAHLARIALTLLAAAQAAWRSVSTARLIAIALLADVVGHRVSDAFMTGELAGSWLFWAMRGTAVGLWPARGGSPHTHTPARPLCRRAAVMTVQPLALA